MNAAVALFIYRLLPEFLLRFLAWLLVHGIYRLRREGMEHIPERGAALIVCNHVSFADAVVVMAACTRPIRFVMDHRIFRAPVLSFIFRESRAIPIAPAKEDPEMLERAYDEVARALEQGELVGIFPEGAITRTGELQTFRNGVRRIIDRTPVPVVPLALAGLWGSVFSRRYAGLWRYLPKAFSPRIRIRAGAPVPPESLDPQRLPEIVLELRGREPWAR
ncbi:MAG: 1-acyl-sn-glycerol-3-phosphate acyltransferase [Betaproteobacteria bacterium]|nr:1-acyl-sn-glycerol-3-phosphate acyltransferase [Betaproteobacteria bacterium]